MRYPLIGCAGMKIRAGDGCEELGHPEMLSTTVFYNAYPGDKLILSDENYKYNIATYRPEIDPRWIYTYIYAPDQCWAAYNHDLSGDTYRQSEYTFTKNLYFRICLRKMNGEAFDGTEDINEIITFETHSAPEISKRWIEDEVRRVSDRVEASRTEGDIVFVLLADTHYNVNGTWSDTQEAIKLLNKNISLNGIIHLGDLTDGMVTGEATRYYVNKVLADLKCTGTPVWVVIGNHDTNYFRRNPDRYTSQQQRELYLDGRDIRYFIDFPKLRLVFLDSFNVNEEQRYGYSPECIKWLEQTLKDIPDNNKALILSHLPPVTRLQYWAKALRGEVEVSDVLQRNSHKILAWINGHNHADRLDNDKGFPIVSIVNAKCEAFSEYKTEGFITPDRKLGETSQEAFDLMIVNPLKEEIRLIRFGAGRNRTIINGKAAWE